MSRIGEIVGITLDRIEQRAYERGKQDATAAIAASHVDAPPALTLAPLTATTLASVFGQRDLAIGETHETQIRAVAGTWEATAKPHGDHLLITITRTG